MFIRNLPSSAGALSTASVVTGFTSGSILYVDSSITLAEDNANLFYDATNAFVGFGTASPGGRLDVGGSISPAANASAFMARVAGTLVEAGSGVHARLSGLEITAPTITAGVATVTDAVTLYISAAPTGTFTNTALALWVDAGRTRLDGDLLLGGDILDNNGNTIIQLTETGSADDFIRITNGTSSAIVSAEGADTAVGLNLRCKNGAGGSTAVNLQSDTTTVAAFGPTFASFTPIAATSTNIYTWLFTAATSTGQAANTETVDFHVDLARTLTWATGAITTQRFFRVEAPTIAFDGASTITTTVTMAIDAAPAAGSNATLTNVFALRVGGAVNTGATSAGFIYQAINVPAHTLTVTGTTGVTSVGPAMLGLGQLTVTDTSAATIDNASALYIAADPVDAGSAVITNAYAIWVDQGKVRFDGAGTSSQVTALGGVLQITASTVNGNNTSSTIAVGAAVSIGVTTYTNDTATLTMTDATTLYISGVPVASTNVVFTNTATALWVDAGQTRLDGDLRLGGNILDNNGNTSISITDTASAVNFLTVINGATANPVILQPGGTDTSIGLRFRLGGATGATDFRFENTGGTIAMLTVSNQGRVVFTEVAAQTNAAGCITVTGIANTTNNTANAETFWVNFNCAVTKTWATGALATQRFVVFQAPTVAFVGASTATTVANVDINAPSAGTNATITNLYGLQVGAAVTGGPTSAGFIYRAVNVPAHTLTVSGTTQVTSVGPAMLGLGQLTITDASAATVDSASTLYISADPVLAGSITLTNAFALWVDQGKVRLDGGGTSAQATTAGGVLEIQASTVNGNNASSTIAVGATASVGITTFTNNTATLTMTDVATLYISGIPVASTNVTFTNTALAIWVDAGTCRFDASIGVGAAPYADQPASSIGTAGGLMIGASSTNNLFDDASNGAGTTAMFIGNAAITVVSDIRLKKDITPTKMQAIEAFRRLNVVDFAWDDPSDTAPVNRNTRGRWTGLIAQETIDVFPFIINAPDSGCKTCRAGEKCEKHSYWFVEYEALVPTLIKGFQEVDTEIARLRNRLTELEARYDR